MQNVHGKRGMSRPCEPRCLSQAIGGIGGMSQGREAARRSCMQCDFNAGIKCEGCKLKRPRQGFKPAEALGHASHNSAPILSVHDIPALTPSAIWQQMP